MDPIFLYHMMAAARFAREHENDELVEDNDDDDEEMDDDDDDDDDLDNFGAYFFDDDDIVIAGDDDEEDDIDEDDDIDADDIDDDDIHLHHHHHHPWFYDCDDDDDDDDECECGCDCGARSSFRKICERLEQNDKTLVSYDRQQQQEEEGEDEDEFAIEDWKDVHRLGNALGINKYLQSLGMTMNMCICKCPTSTRAAEVMKHGIALSPSLRQLTLTCCCAGMQQMLLQGVGMSSTMEELKLWNSPLHISTVTRLLLLPPPAPTRSTLAPASSSSLSSPPLPRPSCFSDFRCQLKHLSLENCNLDNMDMLQLSIALQDNRSLVLLDLDHNSISNVGVMYFCQHWRDDSPLRALHLNHNELDARGAMHLLRASVHHTALITLAMGENSRVGHDGLRQIGEFLAQIVTLQHLEVHGCGDKRISGGGDATTTSATTAAAAAAAATLYEEKQEAACRALADGLRRNASLVTLRIGGNSLGANGAFWIMQALAFHPSLKTLSMERNEIGPLGIKQIGTVLPNVPLKQLDLDFNCFSHWSQKPWSLSAIEAGEALMNGIQNNHTLTEFGMWELPTQWMKPIRFYLELNEECRPLLMRNDDLIAPATIWAYAMAKFTRHGQDSCVYYSLLEQPWLVRAAVAATTSTKSQAGPKPSISTNDVAMDVADDNNNNKLKASAQVLSPVVSIPSLWQTFKSVKDNDKDDEHDMNEQNSSSAQVHPQQQNLAFPNFWSAVKAVANDENETAKRKSDQRVVSHHVASLLGKRLRERRMMSRTRITPLSVVKSDDGTRMDHQDETKDES